MNNLAQFNFNTQQVRVIAIEGEPWFVAKDLCEAIGLSNVGQTLARLDEDEINTIILNDGTSGNPTTAIVSESGMFALILRSSKPEAKPFRKWVTSEVLPSIRKTGGYTATENTSALLHHNLSPEVPTQAIALCKTLLLEAGIEPPIASSWMLSQYAKYDPDKAAVYEDGKKLLAATADIPEPLLSPTEIGKLLAEHQGLEKPLSAIAVNKLLVDRGFQVQAITGDKKSWHLTDSGKLYGKIITDTARGHGKTIFHLRWQPKITDLLAA
ncbi:Bro-N domain-containing protein [Microcoleus sp. bin38.metabat.b11b12b14.051]|uniref:BRO-N domain-containing protein n=1 Tax=Microcoleus sp. bin38.metabat.b11b12b14.051 TaxID=2742709 RepID=UPI0025E9B2BD|nr:Bro-N domain-containing protein [Microcoleus sp. bin38.metabat.b11b12b14.051]